MGGLSRYINILYLPVFLLFIISFFLLTSPSTSADTTVSANATVTVGSACAFNAVVDTPHTATIPSGTNQSDIGQTTFTVVCNDTGGYSIYAVGYSGFEVGNTKLLATINGVLNSTYDINTGTNASGTPSSWAMKLAPSTNLTSSNILNGYGSYSVVPSSYVKVATLVPSSTPVSSSSLTATYRVNIASTQPAGFYNGKVRYVLVNPATNVPNEPKACSANKICYWPNAGNEVTDTMGDQSENYINVVTAITSNMDVNLWPSNFKRTGYGFAGWSDAYDYVANVGSASNPDAHIYGPMANIHLDDMSSGLSLYAVWVKSEGNLQGWNGCTSLSQGNVTALTDQRDGDTYAVAKLADNKCWMIENLRLDADYSNDSSLAQGFGGVFAGLAQSETTFTGSTTANSLYKSDGSGDIKGVNGAALSDIGTTNYPSNRFPRYNNSNTDPSTNETNMTSVDDNVYSYGNYYTWASAIADTNYYTSNQSVSTSICPSGWRLPRGGNKTNEANNDFWYLIVGSINSGVRPANYNSSSAPFYTGQTEGAMMSNKLTSYPNNFVYSGVNNAAKGSFTFYNSSTSSSATSRYSFGLMATDVYPGTDSWSKYELMLIRCMYGNLNQ